MVRLGGPAAIIAAVLVLLGIIAIEAVNRPRRSQRVAPPAPRQASPNGFPPATTPPGFNGANGANGAGQPVGAGRPGTYQVQPPQQPN